MYQSACEDIALFFVNDRFKSKHSTSTINRFENNRYNFAFITYGLNLKNLLSDMRNYYFTCNKYRHSH